MAGFAHTLAYLLLFALASGVAALIAILASKGLPPSFDREMYWTCFMASGIAAAFLFAGGQRINAAVGGARFLALLLANFGLLMFGVAMGCAVGIFVLKKKADTGPSDAVEKENQN